MAGVMVSYRFADGTVVQAIVNGKNSYPDALATMRAEAVRAFQESMAYAMAEPAPEADPIPTLEDES